jgi:hypothetical protein
VAQMIPPEAPASVVSELTAVTERVAGRLDIITGWQWERTGRRSDGATFTIASISRHMIHDPVHHIWDVSGRGPS